METRVSSGHLELIDKLVSQRIIKSQKVIDAFKALDRAFFIPKSTLSPYSDTPHSIGHNATISAPHIHGMALELLKDHLRPGTKSLDIGSGTGYLTLAMAYMQNFQGKAVGIEHIPELVDESNKVMRRVCSQAEGTVEFHTSDGRNGWEAGAPYTTIHVGASSGEIPQALVRQLDYGGRLVIPVGEYLMSQYITIVDKDQEGNIHQTKSTAVNYVPLCDKDSQE